MTISFTTLATRLGKLVGGLNELNTFRQTTLGTRYDTVDNQYESSDQELTDGLYINRDQARVALSVEAAYWASLAAATIQRMVEDDRPGFGASLSSALKEWVRQLVYNNKRFQQSLTTVTVTSALAVGNGKLVASTPGDLVYPDTLTALVTSDASSGSAAYSELVTMQGTGLTDPPTDGSWPKGGGTSVTVQVKDPALDYGLTNGSFLSWDEDDTTPTGWMMTSGTNPTRVVTASSGVRGEDGPYPEFVGDGTTQRLNNFASTLLPNTYYSYSIHLRRNGSVASGTRVKIYAGGATAADIDASALTTDWVQYAGIVKTGATTSGYPSLGIEVNTLASGEKVQAAYAGISALTSTTPLGMYLDVWAGSIAFSTNDAWSITVTLDSGSMTASLIRGIDRLVGLRDFGIVLPSAPATALTIGSPIGLTLLLTQGSASSVDFPDSLVS